MRMTLQSLRQAAQTGRKKLSRRILHWRMRGESEADILIAERKLRGVEQFDKLRKAKVGGYRDYFTDEQCEQLEQMVAKLDPVFGYGGEQS